MEQILNRGHVVSVLECQVKYHELEKPLRKKDFPFGSESSVFIGYSNSVDSRFIISLTKNFGQKAETLRLNGQTVERLC